MYCYYHDSIDGATLVVHVDAMCQYGPHYYHALHLRMKMAVSAVL